jgi:hypothetical protein
VTRRNRQPRPCDAVPGRDTRARGVIQRRAQGAVLGTRAPPASSVLPDSSIRADGRSGTPSGPADGSNGEVSSLMRGPTAHRPGVPDRNRIVGTDPRCAHRPIDVPSATQPSGGCDRMGHDSSDRTLPRPAPGPDAEGGYAAQVRGMVWGHPRSAVSHLRIEDHVSATSRA